MYLVDKSVTKDELAIMAKNSFGNLVKAVVDIKKGIMVVDASLHADEEAFLLSGGSNQDDLWGVNLYPQEVGSDFVEFDSMINLRPSHGNLTRGVDDSAIQKKILEVVTRLVK